MTPAETTLTVAWEWPSENEHHIVQWKASGQSYESYNKEGVMDANACPVTPGQRPTGRARTAFPSLRNHTIEGLTTGTDYSLRVVTCSVELDDEGELTGVKRTIVETTGTPATPTGPEFTVSAPKTGGVLTAGWRAAPGARIYAMTVKEGERQVARIWPIRQSDAAADGRLYQSIGECPGMTRAASVPCHSASLTAGTSYTASASTSQAGRAQ